VAKRTQQNAWNEVYALILLGTGTLLFLALISYVPKDIPTWFPLLNSTSSPNRPAQNFIGPLGAVGAGIAISSSARRPTFSRATLIGFGGAKLFHGELKVSRRLGWIILFVASGACLLHLQPWFLHDWRRVFKIQGPGGWIGYFFGRHVFALCDG
jgi:S-DNA-T family DNA segregation ATPase FtsK/SpoIIIE